MIKFIFCESCRKRREVLIEFSKKIKSKLIKLNKKETNKKEEKK